MDTVTFCLHAAAVAVMGTVIGLERQWRLQHTAGMRTNALVALGADLFVSIPHLLGSIPGPSHLAGQVATGVGFLGGGVILREGLTVRGMNTAATLWCSAAIGALAGAGRLLEAFAATLGVLALHLALRPFSDWVDRRNRRATNIETAYRLRISCRAGQEAVARARLLAFFHEHPTMIIQGLATEEGGGVVADIRSEQRDDRTMEDLMSLVNDEPGVLAVRWEKNESPA